VGIRTPDEELELELDEVDELDDELDELELLDDELLLDELEELLEDELLEELVDPPEFCWPPQLAKTTATRIVARLMPAPRICLDFSNALIWRYPILSLL
jgi:hypothetical protein